MNYNTKFLQAFEAVYDERFNEQMSSLDNREPHTFSKKHEKKMTNLIKRQRKPYFNLISSAGRRAACIIVAIVIFSASALSVKAVREAVFKFITNVFSDHNVVNVESDSDSGYPKTIQEEYYISDLPEGFVQSQVDKTDKSFYIVYSYEERYIIFEQHTLSNFKLNIDNEHNHFEEYTDPNGTVYKIATRKDITVIIWSIEDYVFSVESNLNKECTLNLCKSTKLKD
ncbi:MAG: DUF4367 domain-containing protein [Ruminococcus sp.]|nr:DUF4367 domain-containing protein [Ruminococcus sp.]